MGTLLIVKDKQLKMLPITNSLMTCGIGKEHDFSLDLGDSNAILSIFYDSKKLSVKFSTQSKSLKKALKGPWEKELTGAELFHSSMFTLYYYPWEIEDKALASIKDWCFEDFPKDPRDDNYPQKLLEFLLSSFNLDQGAILHRVNNSLRLLGQKNLKLRDQSAFVLQGHLESFPNQNIVKLSFETHTLLFKAGLVPRNFYLIRCFLKADGEVILYIPEPSDHNFFPEGIFSSLLYLLGQSLSLYLAYQFQKRMSSEVLKLSGKGYFWGSDPRMQRIKKLVDRLLHTDLCVLITGETGTGKEGIAQYFIENQTSKLPFVSLNCAAIPSHLAESILFGHRRGAFTGALQDQMGKLEEACGGILFLDEIGELDLNIQAKILRFLQTGVISPLGGKDKKIKVRIIAATHQDLLGLIAAGKFREDLYFRLNEINLALPPLRERKQDILALAHLFLEDAVIANALEEKLLSSSAIAYLQSYDYPGNIRELKSIIRRSAIISDEKSITAEVMTQFSQGKKSLSAYPMDLGLAKKQFIQNHIKQALEQTSGNKTQAARLLGITPRSLFRFLSESDDSVIEG